MQLTTGQVPVVGAGAAGLYTALSAREGARVTLVSATPLAESSSWQAQDGLAAAVSAQDSPERHLPSATFATRSQSESRGAHQRTDFPEPDPDVDHRHITIQAGGEPRIELWE